MEDTNAPPSVLSIVDVRDRDQNGGSGSKAAYDELYDILSWTPAKSAIRYSSCLCKCLSNLHLEPSFIKKQTLNCFGKEDGFFLQRRPESYIFDPSANATELHVVPTQTKSAFGIPKDSLEYLHTNGRILSSSNGLILLGTLSVKETRLKLAEGHLTGSHHVVNIQVCNPATRQWARLHRPESFCFLLNTGLSSLIECPENTNANAAFPNDFFIAVATEAQPPLPTSKDGFMEYLMPTLTERNKKRLLMYSNGRWEDELCDVSIEDRLVSYDMPVALYCNATESLIIHYLCHNNSDRDLTEMVYCDPYIAAFDMKQKSLSREIALPKEAWERRANRVWGGSRKKLYLHKWNDVGICVVMSIKSQGHVAAWVLENCGREGEAWRTLVDSSVKALGIDEKTERVISVGVARGTGLLFATVLNEWRGYLNLHRPRNVARAYLYVTEGERRGRLEVVGEHHLGSRGRGFTFVSYANTLRPVSLQGADTLTY